MGVFGLSPSTELPYSVHRHAILGRFCTVPYFTISRHGPPARVDFVNVVASGPPLCSAVTLEEILGRIWANVKSVSLSTSELR